MKEGKDDREATKMAASKARSSKPKNEARKRKVSIEDNNSNLKQREEVEYGPAQRYARHRN